MDRKGQQRFSLTRFSPAGHQHPNPVVNESGGMQRYTILFQHQQIENRRQQRYPGQTTLAHNFTLFAYLLEVNSDLGFFFLALEKEESVICETVLLQPQITEAGRRKALYESNDNIGFAGQRASQGS